MESKPPVPIRLVLNTLAVVSLMFFAALSILWASTCAGYFVEWHWSTSDYRGVALETTNGDFVARVPTEFWERRPERWETHNDPETLAEFHTRLEVSTYTSSHGNRCRVIEIPWWWLVLATAILPAWRLCRVRRRPTGMLAKFVGAGIVLLIIIMNLIPRKPEAASIFSSNDEIRLGWPFAVYSSVPIDDGTKWGRFAGGAAAANVLAALLLSFATIGLIQLGTTAVRYRATRHRLRAGLCSSCSYDLTGNTSGVCPECGMACRHA